MKSIQNKHITGSIIMSVLGWFAHLLSPFFKNNADFLGLFFKREGKELLGKGYRSFWILLSIMTITFIAIGFSNGSLRYLSDKMSDPFINWVNIDIPWGNEGLANELIESLDIEEIKTDFGFSSLNGYYKYDLIFRNKKKNGLFRGMGRTIEYESPLLEVIFDKENLIRGQSFKDENDIGFIVTENFLKQLNIDEESGYLTIHYSSDDSNIETDIPLPIIAIVKELPDMAAYATTPYFYNQRYLDITGINPFSPIHTKDLVLFIPGEEEDFNKLSNDIKNMVLSFEKYNERSPSFSSMELNTSFISGREFRISFFPSFDSIGDVKSLYSKLSEKVDLNKNGVFQLYDYKLVSDFPYKNFDYLAVNFISLDKIRTFKEYLYNNHKVELEMSQIESKENFNLVSKLTRFISLILLTFCIINISMFLSNLLKNHLLKIKMNIGTFKAFGMGNSILKRIYMSIIGIFISISIIVSITIAAIFGYFGGIRFILYLLKIELEEQQSYFALVDWWTLVAIVSMLVVSLYAIYVNNNKLFNDTPGNLINNR